MSQRILARPLSAMGLIWKASNQQHTIINKASRPISSLVSKFHCKKQEHVKVQVAGGNIRHMSVQTKFEVINIQDEEDFQKRVIGASVPIIVDFHATWCAPCKILAPRLESIVSKKEGKVTMAKVDIDDNPDLAMEYGVRSVPTVIAVKGGKVTSQFIGVIDDDQIDSFVEKLVIS